MSRAKNPKYESMSLEELKANMGKEQTGTGGSNSPQKNILEQRKKRKRPIRGCIEIFWLLHVNY